MKSFLCLAALAALAANVNAVCPAGAPSSVCGDFTDVQDLVAANSGDYTWYFEQADTESGYNLKLFRFLAGNDGSQIPDQWTKDPVLLLAPARQDCSWWLTVEDDAADSIPKQLFDAGYDVFLGCKRGTTFAQGNTTLNPVDDAEDFWNFNTDTIATEDIPTMVAAINNILINDDTVPTYCKKVQIVSQCLGSSEALSTLSLLPTASGKFIGNLINLAPCAVRD